eukprot:2411261-Rhodomonas_salina.1
MITTQATAAAVGTSSSSSPGPSHRTPAGWPGPRACQFRLQRSPCVRVYTRAGTAQELRQRSAWQAQANLKS